MQNSLCCRKLRCLLCACDRDSQSNYHRRTSKKTNVSFNKTKLRKAFIWSTGRRNGATGGHQAFSDGFQGESIKHSLMDPPEGSRSTKCTAVCAAGNSDACFARVIEISSRIIVGVPAKKPMSASTKRISESIYLEHTQHRTRGWGHWRPSSVLSSEQKFQTQGKLTYLPVLCSFNRTEFQTSIEQRGTSE